MYVSITCFVYIYQQMSYFNRLPLSLAGLQVLVIQCNSLFMTGCKYGFGAIFDISKSDGYNVNEANMNADSF